MGYGHNLMETVVGLDHYFLKIVTMLNNYKICELRLTSSNASSPLGH